MKKIISVILILSLLVVILAGYTNNMARFITTNPGLESRFNRYIDFPDYSSDELYKIFMTLIKKYEYIIDAEAEIYIQELIQSEVTSKGELFGNARFIRNLFEKVLANQANRLAKEQNLSADCLRTIKKEDCQMVLDLFHHSDSDGDRSAGSCMGICRYSILRGPGESRHPSGDTGYFGRR